MFVALTWFKDQDKAWLAAMGKQLQVLSAQQSADDTCEIRMVFTLADVLEAKIRIVPRGKDKNCAQVL